MPRRPKKLIGMILTIFMLNALAKAGLKHARGSLPPRGRPCEKL
jgi:hypothetical protein